MPKATPGSFLDAAIATAHIIFGTQFRWHVDAVVANGAVFITYRVWPEPSGNDKTSSAFNNTFGMPLDALDSLIDPVAYKCCREAGDAILARIQEARVAN